MAASESAAAGAETAAAVSSEPGLEVVVLVALLEGTVDVTVTASGAGAGSAQAATDTVRTMAAMAARTLCMVAPSHESGTMPTITKCA